ncbi:MAG TPA: PepSY domain-containing protein [Rhodanobacteraceae bacterium]|nr:PepSY domain-containing protein [Rhodanobacteraceae bacterium]
MHKHTLAAALSATLLLAGGTAFAQDAPMQTTTTTTTTRVGSPTGALSESAIKADIANAGYQEVKGLKFEDGVWQAKARGGNDKWVRIKVGPTTGKVYEADAPSRLNKNEIKAKLTAQGYQDVDDVDFDDGLWSADAKNPEGKKVDVLVDPNDGSVVAVKQD